MVFDPLHVVAEGGRAGHRFDGRSHVVGRGLMAGVVFGFEAADDLADLVGLEAAGQEGEQGVVVLSAGSPAGSRRAASRGPSGGGRVRATADPFASC